MESDSYNLALLAMFVALIAAVAGPLVAICIGRKQIEAQTEIARRQVVSPMRQQWINDLRNTIAEIRGRTSTIWGLDESDRRLEIVKIRTLEAKLLLLINPKESEHRSLADAVSRLVSSVSEGGVSSQGDEHSQVTELAQKILKTEWEVTKGGES